ncbi:hypothetical protein C8R47DRAFT_1195058 [Mycena vitilis]|nr:hypothetical protein C8R47DRAFT_1195058 [Mycena vitilis]
MKRPANGHTAFLLVMAVDLCLFTACPPDKAHHPDHPPAAPAAHKTPHARPLPLIFPSGTRLHWDRPRRSLRAQCAVRKPRDWRAIHRLQVCSGSLSWAGRAALCSGQP